jgi:hypothetical protein
MSSRMAKLNRKGLGLALLIAVVRLSTVAGWMPMMMPQKSRHGFRSGGLKGGFAVDGSQQGSGTEMMKIAHICGKSAACSNVERLRMTNKPEGGELRHSDEEDSASNIKIWGREISTSALALGFLVVWQSISILFHHYQDGMPFEEAFFFSVDTGLSIGYGTIPLDNDLSRVGTILFARNMSSICCLTLRSLPHPIPPFYKYTYSYSLTHAHVHRGKKERGKMVNRQMEREKGCFHCRDQLRS